MKTYTVNAERDGKFWLVTIPEIDGATQGRTLNEVPVMAKDYISIVTGEPEESFELDLHLILPQAAARHWEQARALRQRELDVRAEAAREARAAALALQESGYTVRDIGAALELSHQRAQQLVQARH